MENNSLCDSLLKWLETFPGREGIAIHHLTDGVAMANVLHQIAPEYFTQFWLTKIKPDVGDNWRLKVSNLRKVQQGIVDYYQEQLNQNIKHFPLPDLSKIGEHGDKMEMGQMLQLLLGCAVNCENKQQYIEAIMNMEERVQKVIMEAIQELMLRESSPGILLMDGEGRPDLGPASFHPHIKTILEQLETATQSRDETIQRCHELEQQISVINEEKTALSSENEKLLNRLDAWETGGELGTSTLRYKDLKKQIDGLQDELYKLETSRDEYRTKADLLERENQEIQTRNEELQRLADEARSLKDEVDALREMSERAVVYEGTMETYKKKLEELSDLKRQVRILEEKNSDYVQHNMELEEEVKKSGTWRPQLDLYKKQVGELHQKLADEAKKTDRQIFENKKLIEKMEAIMQEKDRLTKERDALKENIEELKCHVSTLISPDTTSRPPSDLSDVELLEIVPHEIREKLMRLQHENSLLKQRAAEGGSTEQLPVLQTLVSDLQERQNSLTLENRQLNHRIMELESEVEEAKAAAAVATPMAMAVASRTFDGSSVRPTSGESRRIAELERKLAEQTEKVCSLEESLSKKENEMGAMEERYKKYLGKAKSVIKTLDPKHNPALVPDVSNLRSTIYEKERIIENLERESEKSKMVRDMEEKLITTAFYNFGMQMHRQMISQRLSTMDQGHSFMSRQRQASTRRVPMSNRHTPSSSQFEDMRIS
ncbi:protein Hook homolog 3-like isoform X1 [Homarus americanus]|uniref:protein Hook homolog 3-like isoform X1 n=1 Tax=Homarus americanus TaxID=6706 RepID=UPI001C458CE8|nr:protein Hook homolog 3-like isoform X1 [Homarus americanus]